VLHANHLLVACRIMTDSLGFKTLSSTIIIIIRIIIIIIIIRLSVVSGDARETLFLFQRLSILIQHFNSVLVHESFCSNDEDLDF